jgi:hypothetical protein
MTLKIETHFVGKTLTIRLTGRMREEHLDAVRAVLDSANSGAALNLGNVNLVGVEVVRFLAGCERAGNKLVDCSPYIRDWIDREHAKKKSNPNG